jgi:proteasome accessory factor A
MNGRRMFGTETEYAVIGRDRAGAVVPPQTVAGQLLDHASTRLPNAPALDAGIFLQNGSRLYVDAGYHPEYSSPECCNPWDVVRYAKAGDLILQRLCEGVSKANRGLSEVLLFKGNVDYSGAATTWGSHESYLHRADPILIQQHLIPHLVSRVIYTGAGGFNPLSAGLEFTLSPRAHHIVEVISHESTSSRGLVHTRDESLSCSGYRRQHLICGESLRSDRAAWLRAGVTALIVAMIETGIPTGRAVALVAPLNALRTFARDVTCKATAVTAAGAKTAIQIQRHYLTLAHDHMHDAFMPVWAPAVCAEWSNLLDRLEGAPGTVTRTLDWAFKWTLYRDRAKRLGFEWEMLPSWTHVAEVLYRALTWRSETQEALDITDFSAADGTPSTGVLAASLVLAPDGPLRNEVRSLTPYLQAKRLEWGQLDGFLRLRQQLMEIDFRFGQIGVETLFAALERPGFTDHSMEGVDRIADAVEHPPGEGRARVRGQVVGRAAAQGRQLACAWNQIFDLVDPSMSLDLSDPFAEEEIWSRREMEPGDTPETGLWARLARFRIARPVRAGGQGTVLGPERTRRRT